MPAKKLAAINLLHSAQLWSALQVRLSIQQSAYWDAWFHVFFLPTYSKLLLVNRTLLNFWWPSLDFPHNTVTDTVVKLCVYIYQNSLSLRKSVQYSRTKGELNLCQISKIDTVWGLPIQYIEQICFIVIVALPNQTLTIIKLWLCTIVYNPAEVQEISLCEWNHETQKLRHNSLIMNIMLLLFE